MAQHKNNVHILHQQFTRSVNSKKHQDDYVAKVHKRRLIAISTLFLLAVVVLGSQIFNTHRQIGTTHAEVQTSQTKLDKVKAKQDDLKLQVKELNDADYLTKYIRYKYYYTKKGETVYSLPNDSAKSLTDTNK